VDKLLRDHVEAMSSDVIRLTQDLIRIPSPGGHEKEIARKIDGVMRALRYDLVFTDDVGNIVGVILGSDPGSTVVMTSHMDTVKPDGIESWSRSPFSGDLVHDRIEGVGAADCKGGLAAQIFAGHVVASGRVRPVGHIVVAATVAEEHGFSIGVRHLLATTLPELGMEPCLVVLGEPTGLKIGTGQDGRVAIDIDVRGPAEGAVRRAADQLFRWLKAHCGGLGVRDSHSVIMVDQPRQGASGRGCDETIRLWLRLFPGDSADDVLGWLEGSVLADERGIDAVSFDAHIHEEEQSLYTGHRRRVRLVVPSWSTDLSHPMVERARTAMIAAGCEWIPTNWKMGRWGIGTAGAVVTCEFAVPAIGFGPGAEEQAHACNESVSAAALVAAVFGTAVIMDRVSAAPRALPLDVIQTHEARSGARVTRGGSR
jgi:acetylornithine deacetylase/succinyl-diaminopimelate desuccinylase-like protein